MKIRVLISTALLVFATPVFSQTALPYFTGWDNGPQQAGWQTFRTGSTAASSWQISTNIVVTTPQSLVHLYPVGGSSPTKDWHVSPPFNFSGGGMIDSIRHHFSGFGTPMAGDSVALWLLVGSPDPALATSKILLHDFVPGYTANSTWEKTTAINIPATAGSSYIAFQYATTINWLDVRFDNLRISGSGSGITEELNAQPYQIYPNPASDFITVERLENSYDEMTFDLCTTNGAVIYSNKIAPGQASSQIPVRTFPDGIYFLRSTIGNVTYNQKLVIAH